MADKKQQNDPTVTSARGASDVPEAPPIEQADDAAVNKEYRENPDKPDPSTVGQVEVLPDEK